MPIPFPGMDPYLENPAFWPDFHSTFINYWREALAEALPSHYSARIGEKQHETYIEILHRPDHALVAVLELLSPAN